MAANRKGSSNAYTSQARAKHEEANYGAANPKAEMHAPAKHMAAKLEAESSNAWGSVTQSGKAYGSEAQS